MKNTQILLSIVIAFLLFSCTSIKNKNTATNKTLIDEQYDLVSNLIPCELDTNENGPISYWLYKPENERENMPLVIYLHGGSGKGADLTLITAVDGFPQYLESGELSDVDAYVIIPQVPNSQNGWVKSSESLHELIEYIIDEFDIDEDNISLTGHSMGGTGTYNIALTYQSSLLVLRLFLEVFVALNQILRS